MTRDAGPSRVGSVAFAIMLALGGLGSGRDVGAQTARDPSAVERAFADLYETATHARCVNCHGTAEGIPTIGESQAVPHPMNITLRHNPGGSLGNTCATCHQIDNSRDPGGPPGARSACAKWQMPKERSMALSRTMTQYDLCRGWQEGVRLSFAHAPACGTAKPGTLAEFFVHHIENDGLIAWAFRPGLDRESATGGLNRLKTAARIWAPTLETPAWCDTLKETPPALIEKGGPKP